MPNYEQSILSQLVRLMAHVLKWTIQPVYRTASWVFTIRNARQEIEKIKRKKPSLNDNYLRKIWNKALRLAKLLAEDETGIKPKVENLTWDEVFNQEYTLDDE